MAYQADSLISFKDHTFPLVGSFWNEIFAERHLARSMVGMMTDNQRVYTGAEPALEAALDVTLSQVRSRPFTHSFDRNKIQFLEPVAP